MEVIHSVYDHFVLPPKLPGHENGAMQAVSQDVLKRVVDACERLASLTPEPLSDTFRTTQSALVACQKINNGSYINKTSTLQQFKSLDTCRVLIFHVVEQNAAMLIYRTQGQVRKAKKKRQLKKKEEKNTKRMKEKKKDTNCTC